MCIGGAVYLVSQVVTLPGRERELSVQRAARYGKLGLPVRPQAPHFKQRVVGPMRDRLAGAVLKVNPRTSIESIQVKILSAGMGRRLLFARRLRTCGRDLEAAVSAALGVGPEEACSLRTKLPPLDHKHDAVPDERLRKVDQACQETVFRLVTEIRLCLGYVSAVFGNTPVHHVVFVGGGAKYRRLCQRVASGLGLPARAADPIGRLVRTDGAPAAGGPVWATAVGLALQGARMAAPVGASEPSATEDNAIARLTLAV